MILTKRKAPFILVPFVLFAILCGNIHFQAADNKSYYGDGTSAKWADLAPYLPILYRNTPYISVSNGKSTKTFNFNIELFCDLGLFVYGEPNSVQFTGTVNDFKATSGGYFRSENSKDAYSGEFRFLGYSIHAIPITNSRFPDEVKANGAKVSLVKYSDLPIILKTLYNINSLANEAFISIRDLIESANSPVWNFTTTMNGKEVSLRQRLTELELFKNDKPSISLLDYGIVYSWAESGGVVRLFFRSEKNSEPFYSYATFSGPVSIDFSAKLPQASSSMKIANNPSGKIGQNTFYMGSKDKTLSFEIALNGVMHDDFGKLSEFMKQFAYTRDNMAKYSINIEDKEIYNVSLNFDENSVSFNGTLRDYVVHSSQLVNGRNVIKLKGCLKIFFSRNSITRVVEAPCFLEITVVYEKSATQIPTATPTNKPSLSTTSKAEDPDGTPHIYSPTPTLGITNETTENKTPSVTPRLVVNRKW